MGLDKPALVLQVKLVPALLTSRALSWLLPGASTFIPARENPGMGKTRISRAQKPVSAFP